MEPQEKVYCYDNKKEKDTKKKHNNPQTGDSIMTYVVILALSLGTSSYILRKIENKFG